MNANSDQIALIAGGAGFLGSHIAKSFYHAGYKVVVMDGLLDGSGGNERNLQPIRNDIHFAQLDVRDAGTIADTIRASDVIVDCMAWTSHRKALQDPIYDLHLNAESHLHLLKHLHSGQKIVYLGSRSQYGIPDVSVINEETSMVPVDIQGIHKLAAESYYRVYSRLKNLNVISLRFPNCFGENQPTQGEDVGLVGGFIRDLLDRKLVEVFGSRRRRALVYAPDLAEVVLRLSRTPISGFSAFNIKGKDIHIKSLVEMLIELIGHGAYQLTPLPADITAIDVGNAVFDNTKLGEVIEEIPLTDLREALTVTIKYFKEKM
ncbi:MAG: NAD-dependent epimerase/dehydratase family protein [Anaerolineales bacterium]|jgi:UDP-glucose 4-epimerase|nr:NAD-dependent epimerase/dehydratase family protein [Anaerolineales bacterium]